VGFKFLATIGAINNRGIVIITIGIVPVLIIGIWIPYGIVWVVNWAVGYIWN